MSYKGILVDVNYCSGCKTCVVACQMEHGYSEKQFGVNVFRLGPMQIEGDKWEYDFFPQFTDWCDLCEERVAAGKKPSCVQQCQAQCLIYGDVEELSKSIEAPKQYVCAVKEA